jgi:hypothetical protein
VSWKKNKLWRWDKGCHHCVKGKQSDKIRKKANADSDLRNDFPRRTAGFNLFAHGILPSIAHEWALEFIGRNPGSCIKFAEKNGHKAPVVQELEELEFIKAMKAKDGQTNFFATKSGK